MLSMQALCNSEQPQKQHWVIGYEFDSIAKCQSNGSLQNKGPTERYFHAGHSQKQLTGVLLANNPIVHKLGQMPRNKIEKACNKNSGGGSHG